MPDKNQIVSSGQKRWLAFRISSLGDVVLTSGVLEYLRRKRGWSFTMATRKPYGDLLRHNPAIELVREFSQDDLHGLRGVRTLRGLAAEFAGQGLLDLHVSLRSRLLAMFWAGPVLRYPKFSLERRLFLRGKTRENSAGLLDSRVTQRYALAVEDTPPPAGELRPRVYLEEAEIQAARRRISAALSLNGGPPPGNLVVLHPYATHERKAWPRSHWLELAGQLDRRALPWLAVGQGERLFPGHPRDLSNLTALRELCALLSQAALLVTGDSGPMHLAVAVQTPVLALFGPTTREWGFFPCGISDRILELPLPCRPCSLHGARPCPRNGECLQGISADAVMGQIMQMAR